MKRTAKKPIKKVRCCDCKSSTRDTCGASFNMKTGIFFMGTCSKGNGDGVPGRVFMENERQCNDFN